MYSIRDKFPLTWRSDFMSYGTQMTGLTRYYCDYSCKDIFCHHRHHTPVYHLSYTKFLHASSATTELLTWTESFVVNFQRIVFSRTLLFFVQYFLIKFLIEFCLHSFVAKCIYNLQRHFLVWGFLIWSNIWICVPTSSDVLGFTMVNLFWCQCLLCMEVNLRI